MEIESIISKKLLEKKELKEDLPSVIFDEFWNKSDNGLKLINSAIRFNPNIAIFYLSFINQNKLKNVDYDKFPNLKGMMEDIFELKLNSYKSPIKLSTDDIKEEINSFDLLPEITREEIEQKGFNLIKEYCQIEIAKIQNIKDPKSIELNSETIKTFFINNSGYINDLFGQKFIAHMYRDIPELKNNYSENIKQTSLIVLSLIKIINEK